jgi:hypothetical protein
VTGVSAGIFGFAGVGLAISIVMKVTLSAWTDYAGIAVLVIVSAALLMVGLAKLQKPEAVDRTYRAARQFDQYAGA